MKIVDKTTEQNITFDSLKPGDVFQSEDSYFWIKTKSFDDCKSNAINLENGEAGFFEMNELVTPFPNAKLVIN